MKKVLLPGFLALYCVIAGLGVFLAPATPDLVLYPWLTGYLLLAFSVSYTSFFSRGRFNFFPFIVLGVILLNFFVQSTGGTHSFLWPAYFLFATVVAILSPLWRTFATIGLILTIETANLALSHRFEPDRWPIYAGSALSLFIVPALISHIIHRTKGEKEQVEHRLEKLIKHADSIDPLAKSDTLEAVVEKGKLQSIKAALDRDKGFIGVINMIYGFVPAHTYALFLKERRGGGEAFVLRARRSDSDESYLAPIGEVLTPDKDNGIITGCAQYTQPQSLSNMDLRGSTLGYYTRSMPIKSVLAIPIVQHNENIGVLVVDSLEGGAFSLETQDLLSRFSPFFIEIIEKVQLSTDLASRADIFQALHDIGAALNSSLELSDILRNLGEAINKQVPNDFCAFVQYDEKNRTVLILHQSGPVIFRPHDASLLDKLTGAVRSFTGSEERQDDEAPLPVEQGTVINRMLQQWEEQRQAIPYHFGDPGEREVPHLITKEGVLTGHLHSLSCWPLARGEKFIGAFFLGSRRKDAFQDSHLTLLDILMNQVVLIMDNALLHRQISNLARTDGLTGLLNHRTFMEKLGEEYRRLDRDPRPFSILLMDIDKFKGVNDKYGHPIGDVAIKTVARVLKDTARGSDFVARYGGEEFAVGMVDTASDGAFKTAERIRSIVEKTLVTRVSDGELRVTVSVGVSSFPEDTRNTPDLVTMADNALYLAKRTGRNRVCLHRDIANRSQEEPAPAK